MAAAHHGMVTAHHDTVTRLPLVEATPSVIVRSLAYPRMVVVPVLVTVLSPLTSLPPRDSNGPTTSRTMASRTLDVPERESPRPWQHRQPQQHEKTRQEKFRQPPAARKDPPGKVQAAPKPTSHPEVAPSTPTTNSHPELAPSASLQPPCRRGYIISVVGESGSDLRQPKS